MIIQSFIDRAGPTGILGVMVTQHGKLRAKHLWDEECRRNVYSASKSFTSAAVGLAIKEGLLSLDEKLTDAFREDLPEEISPYLAEATVKDLLTMCLGQEKPELMGAQRPLYTEEDWVRLSLAFPFSDKPGTKFLYNNVGPYLAGILVQRRAGCDLVSYLTPRLFQPLGITRPTWETDPLGNAFGAGGLFLTMTELNKLGLLYLQDGAWEGRQILTPEWVRESTSFQVPVGRDPEYGYGYLFWGGPHGSFRADGKYCQLSIILRDKDAVITTVAECRDSEPLMQAIFEEIYEKL